MFERFSDDARRAVVVAQEVARSVGARRIDVRHLLVGLANDDGPASEALVQAGVDLDSLDAALVAELGPTKAERRPGHIRLGRDTVKAMRRALDATVRLDREVIDGSTLLLGMLLAEVRAVRHLRDAGADLAALRRFLEQETTPESGSP